MKKAGLVLLAGSIVAGALAVGTPAHSQALTTPCPVSSLSGIAFADSLHGTAVGVDTCHAGVVLQTGNGGATWVRRTLPPGQLRLNAVSQPDRCHVWAVGDTLSQQGGPGIALATSNCGATWSRQTVPQADFLDGVSFVDDLHGWAGGGFYGAGNSVVFATSNGGKTWADQTGAGASTLTRGLWAIKFVNTLQGWAVGADESGPVGAIIATVDGGITWTRQDFVNDYIRDVDVNRDGLHGWVVGLAGNVGSASLGIWTTVDGGHPWIPAMVPTDNMFFTGVSFSGTSTGWVVGSASVGSPPKYSLVILKSTDGGSTWVRQPGPAGVGFDKVAALSTTRVCATGGALNVGMIFCSGTGGQTWKRTF